MFPLFCAFRLSIVTTEKFSTSASSKSRSVKPHLVNNYIKTSTVAFDYAKCRNKLSSALHENEKKGAGFFCEFELAIGGKKIYSSTIKAKFFVCLTM